LIVTDGPPRGENDSITSGYSSLHQEIDVVPNLRCRVLEDVNEGVADRGPLLLRILHARQRVQEPLLGVDRDQLDAQVSAESSLDLFTFV